ncbi:MAG: sodium:solute symporter [Kiritimatiellia bacterium]
MHILDWLIIALFFSGLIGVGFRLSSKTDDTEGFFLSHRNMPWWAASASVAATALSAGTFVGVPQVTYTGNLTWMLLLIGSTIGGVIAALCIVPVLYRAGTMTIYGYLRERFGPDAESAASWFFVVGTLLVAGARHFIASIVVSMTVFGSIEAFPLITSIVILGAVATLYTVCGGIQAVIWTDVVQVLILVGAAVFCICILMNRIPLAFSEITEVLRGAPGGNKLQLWNFDFSLDNPYTIWAAGGAYALLTVAQYGCCHDNVQRLLTCRSPRQAAVSMIVSRFIQVPIVMLFLVIGALLYIFYQCPDLMGQYAPAALPEGSKEVFPFFILHELPAGALGLALAGMLAASMSSFDSAVNSLASVARENLRKNREQPRLDSDANRRLELRQSRWFVMFMGGALTLFSIAAVFLQEAGGQRLIDFALGVLTFSYAGLFGVFVTAIATKRGNQRSAVAALWVGALIVLLVQPYIMPHWTRLLSGSALKLAWPWWMVLGGGLSFLVCFAGRADDN